MAKDIELKAVKLVLNYERKRRWKASPAKAGSGYDILSVKGKNKKFIEVKGQSAIKPRYVGFHKYTFRKVGQVSEDMEKYFLYIVYNIKKKPKLKIIPSSLIFRNLEIDANFFLPAGVIRKIKDDSYFP